MTGPCGGLPHLFEHYAMHRIGEQQIVCVFCGVLAVTYTQEQLDELREAVRENRY